jgi:copper homeostasis protein
MAASATIHVYGTCLYDAQGAGQGGADAFHLGGTVEGFSTPSPGVIQLARRAFPGQLYAVIRPIGERDTGPQRGPCDRSEMDAMFRDLALCREEGVDGVLLGVRSQDGSLDVALTGELVEAAAGLRTMLAVFDGTLPGLAQARELGADQVLWSGLTWDGRLQLPDQVEASAAAAGELARSANAAGPALVAWLEIQQGAMEAVLKRAAIDQFFVQELVRDDSPFAGSRTVDPRKVEHLRELLTAA